MRLPGITLSVHRRPPAGGVKDAGVWGAIVEPETGELRNAPKPVEFPSFRWCLYFFLASNAIGFSLMAGARFLWELFFGG